MEKAGEVEERILQAALRVFIARGYEGASIDEIADVARAGKPSIYNRFTSKEILFREVVLRWAQQSDEMTVSSTTGTIEERFQSAAILILQRAITDESIGLIRSVLGEATRHPELATTIHHTIRAHGTETVMKLVAELAEAEEIRSLPAFAPGNLEATARHFIDLVLLPVLLSSLYHADLTRVKETMEDHAREAATFFLSGCGYRQEPDGT
ncbi:TetR/AcrR family transcriptional regulator [Rhizobium paknamense]|uniref:AcrR family transcriptional regulator n=1 Tax=Rhizobium paknamense TaxID=1206817 RepID=A0ABU0IJI2_9HYPH|nr:TetR/AcrR family transcriptional regulator [Rhizobium paknamense]MDQ0458419.1 AcrR family transcriptional regulator [Rhizobium paknamense]